MSDFKVPDYPWMSASEIQLIVGSLPKDGTMLEWGSGGSTMLFPQYVKEYHSIEHNKEWYDKVTEQVKLRKLTNVTTYHVTNEDDGEDFPSTRERYKTYINYVSTLGKKFDRILIDGRARQFCSEACLPYLKPNSLVYFHDFWMQGRERYRKIALKYYDEVASIVSTPQTLVILKPKPEFVNENIIHPTLEE